MIINAEDRFKEKKTMTQKIGEGFKKSVVKVWEKRHWIGYGSLGLGMLLFIAYIKGYCKGIDSINWNPIHDKDGNPCTLISADDMEFFENLKEAFELNMPYEEYLEKKDELERL